MVLYAVDDQESKAYSLKVNFLVRAVAFSVERADVKATSRLTTPPNSKVKDFLVASSSFALQTAMQNSTQPVYCRTAPGAWTSRPVN